MTPSIRATVVCALLLIAPAVAAFFAAAPTAATLVDIPGAGGALSNPANSTVDSVLVRSPTGETAALWIEHGGSNYSVWAAWHSETSGWSPAAFMGVSSNVLGSPRLAFDVGGNATAVWVDFGTPNSLWYGRAPRAGAWPTGTLLRTTFSQVTGAPGVATSDTGQAFVGWGEVNDSGRFTVWGATMSPSGDPGEPTNLFLESEYAYYAGTVAVSGGNGLVFFENFNGADIDFMVGRYSTSQGWIGSFIAAEHASDTTTYLTAAADGLDRVTLVAEENRAGSPPRIVASRAQYYGPWDTFTPVLPDFDIVEPMELKLNPDGSGFLMLGQRTSIGLDDVMSAVAVRVDADGVWEQPHMLTNDVLFRSVGDVAVSQDDAYFVVSPVSNDSYDTNVAQWTRAQGCAGYSATVDAGIGTSVIGSGRVTMGPDGRGVMTYLDDNGTPRLRWAPFEVARPPQVTIETPTTGQVHTQPIALVTGTGSPGATVRVGGNQAKVAADGSYFVPVGLQAGPNDLAVELSDAPGWEGCTASAAVAVVFDDPVTGLEARVAELEAQLANATGDTAVLEQQLADVNASLAQAQADLAAANAAASAAQAASAAAGAAASAAQADAASAQQNASASAAAASSLAARLAAEEANGTATQQELHGTQADLTAAQQEAADAKAAADSASGSVMLALAVGAVGALLGVAGIAVAMRKGKGP